MSLDASSQFSSMGIYKLKIPKETWKHDASIIINWFSLTIPECKRKWSQKPCTALGYVNQTNVSPLPSVSAH